MAISPLPLPTPGQTNWAGPLNASLEQLNQGIGGVDEAAASAQDSADLAAQYAAQAGEAQDGAIATILSDANSDSRAVLDESYASLSASQAQMLGGFRGDSLFDAFRQGVIDPTLDYRVVVLGSSSSNGAYTTKPEKAVFQRLAYLSGVTSYLPLDTVSSPVSPGGMRWWTGSEGNTTSANYFPTARRTALSNVVPNMVIHMIGENDYFYGTTLANYRANMLSALSYIESVNPSVIQVLVHSHGRNDVASPVAPWNGYRDVLKDIASLSASRYFIDTMEYFYPLGTMTDNRGGMLHDTVHPGDGGHKYLSRIIGAHLGLPDVDAFTTEQTWDYALPTTSTAFTTAASVIGTALTLPAVNYPREFEISGSLWVNNNNAAGYINAVITNAATGSPIQSVSHSTGAVGAKSVSFSDRMYVPPRIRPGILLQAYPNGSVTIEGDAGAANSLSRIRVTSIPL